MTTRIAPDRAFEIFPQIPKSLYALCDAISEVCLDKRMLYLVEVRASQLNGCAFCLDMHNEAAREAGEDQQRLDVVAAWRNVPWFDDKERAALSWCEQLTLVSEGHPSDEEIEQLSKHFTEQEILALTAMVLKINCWNRVVAALHFIPERKS
jgi:AhpD family alkylhydroperoxidase